MNGNSQSHEKLMKEFFDIALMDEQQFLEQLGERLQELTEQPAFEVFSIATHKEKWICVDKNDKQSYSKKAKEAEDYDLFNLVVIDHNRILGYINREDLREEQWNKMVRWNEKSLDAETKLTDVIGKLFRDSSGITRRERSPLYFVNLKLNGVVEPLGIITFWDLNRAPAYTLSYAVLVYLEHTLLDLIRETHETWEDHSSIVEKCKSEQVKILLRMRNPTIEEISAKWYLRDLIEFCEKDPHVSPLCTEIDETLMECLDGPRDECLRNRIGHSIKLLVRDDKNYRCDLEKLERLWSSGKKAFGKFSNPKVRIKSQKFRGKSYPSANGLEFG